MKAAGGKRDPAAVLSFKSTVDQRGALSRVAGGTSFGDRGESPAPDSKSLSVNLENIQAAVKLLSAFEFVRFTHFLLFTVFLRRRRLLG